MFRPPHLCHLDSVWNLVSHVVGWALAKVEFEPIALCYIGNATMVRVDLINWMNSPSSYDKCNYIKIRKDWFYNKHVGRRARMGGRTDMRRNTLGSLVLLSTNRPNELKWCLNIAKIIVWLSFLYHGPL